MDVAQNSEILLGVFREFVIREHHASRYISTQIAHNACESESITTVITLANEDEYFLASHVSSKSLRNSTRDRPSGVFHQDDGRDAVAFGGEAVDLTHLFRRQDLEHSTNLTHRI